MNIKLEYIKGILFVRLDGNLTKRTINKFNEEIIPVVLKHGLKYIVVNLEKLNSIDAAGIEALMNLNNIVSRWNGKTSLCSLNNETVRLVVENSTISNKYYETSNELTALEVFKI